MSSVFTPLEAEEAELQSRLAAVREARSLITKVREILDINPRLRSSLAAELRDLVGGDGAAVEAPPSPRPAVAQASDKSTQPPAPRPAVVAPLHRRLVALLTRLGNQPTTIRVLAEQLNTTGPTIRKIVADRYEELFEQLTYADDPAGYWRLKAWPPSPNVSGDQQAPDADDEDARHSAYQNHEAEVQ